jgi:hypothetical protein
LNLILNLSPETEIRLREYVVATGKQPEQLALEALQDKLAADDPRDDSLPANQWLQEFDAWVGTLRSHNPQVDDSRESMYPDRW